MSGDRDPIDVVLLILAAPVVLAGFVLCAWFAWGWWPW